MLPLLGGILKGVGALAGIGGGAAKGASDQRTIENDLISRLHQTKQQALLQALLAQSREGLDRGDLDLKQRSFQLQEPSVHGKRALLGALLQGYSPAQSVGGRVAAHMPKISGGMGLSPAHAGILGKLLNEQGISSLQNPQQFSLPAPTDFQSGVLDLPQLKKSGLLEKIMGGVGLAGSVVGGLNQAFGSKPQTPPYNPGARP